MKYNVSFKINGNQKFSGEITASSSKNAILPIIAACILSKNEITIHNCPDLTDVTAMLSILLHKDISFKKYNNTLAIKADNINDRIIPNTLTSQLRTSCLFIGPILARTGKITIAMPGGCNIGARPIDIHLSLFKTFGADITIKDGYITAKAPHRLKGCHFFFV